MGRTMEEHFRDMERMMDGVFGNRVWERSPVAGKEVNVGVAVFPIICTIFDYFISIITNVKSVTNTI